VNQGTLPAEERGRSERCHFLVFSDAEKKILNAKARKHITGTFQQIYEQRHWDEKLISKD